MKKIAFYTLASLCASTAMAQTSTQMTMTGGTITAGGCNITGITGLTVVGSTITPTGSLAFSGTCTGTTGGGGGVTAIISPATQNYVINSPTGSAAPAVTITSSDVGVSCTLRGSDGSSNTAAAGGTITFAAPTAAGTVTYSASCSSTTTSTTSVTASPSSVSVTASPYVNQPPADCAATQKSTFFGAVQLSRQCTGTASFGAYHAAYTGNLYNLVDVLGDKTHPGPFPNLISGYTMVMPILTGNFVSLKFNAANSGQMQFTSDPSYGDGGIISISTTPGDFNGPTVLRGGYGVCTYSYGASNSMWFGMGGADCPLVQGQDYYINFAGVDVNGTQQCFNSAPNSCGTEKVSYQVVSSH